MLSKSSTSQILHKHALAAVVLALFMLSSQVNAALEPINVSIQPAVFWAVPFWIALQEGFFEELGLAINYEVFTSGAPQVAAAADSKAWDVGGAGCVPNIIGGTQGIQLMAISDDASATSALVGNAAGASAWPPDDPSFPVAITPNSTVHYAALKCLDDLYTNYSSSNFVYQPPAEVITSLTEGTLDYGSLWAPNLYTVLDTVEGSDILCSGDHVGAIVPEGIMVREEYGDEKPELVASFLTAWIRGIGFLKNPRNIEQTTLYIREFNEETLPGSSISDEAIRQDITLRPMFSLDEQLDIFSRDNGKESTVDNWYIGVSDFLVESGVLNQNPPVQSYITDKYLKLVANNETLREYSRKSSYGYVDVVDMDTGEATEAPSSATAILYLTRILLSGVVGLITVFLYL